MKSKPFVLSVRAVILDQQKRCLILKRHLKSFYHPGLWEFPGGKMDPGESLSQALVREVKEETGFTVALIKILGTSQWPMKERVVVYLIMQAKIIKGKFKESDESSGWDWVKIKELGRVDLCPQFKEFANHLRRFS